MSTLARTALAVVVITGWFLALLWLVVSVSQTALVHTVFRDCADTGRLVPAEHLNDPLGVSCWR